MRNKIKLNSIIFLGMGLAILVILLRPSKDLKNILRSVGQKYVVSKGFPPLRYNIDLMNIPMGYLDLDIQDEDENGKDFYRGQALLKPPALLNNISFDNLGFHMTSFIDKQSLLPRRFETIDVYSAKKGKNKRTIEYHHPELFMHYKTQDEDIEDDTRDYVSLLIWLMSQNYERDNLVKSTLNVNRKIYLVVGKVKDFEIFHVDQHDYTVVYLRVQFLQIKEKYGVVSSIPIDIAMVELQDTYIPLLMKIRKGWLRSDIWLN